VPELIRSYFNVPLCVLRLVVLLPRWCYCLRWCEVQGPEGLWADALSSPPCALTSHETVSDPK